MTGITDMLNLPSLEEALQEEGVTLDAAETPEDVTEPNEQDIQKTVEKLHALTAKMALLDGADHRAAMDELYKEILGHARDLMDYGFNIDSPRARGIFEVASTMYGHAMSAANSKRDMEIKTLKLALDQRKLELDEKRNQGDQAATIDDSHTIIVEDRNELIKRIRAQRNSG